MDFEDKFNALKELNLKETNKKVDKKELIDEITKACTNYGDEVYKCSVDNVTCIIPITLTINGITYHNVCDYGYLLSWHEGTCNLDNLTISELERVVEEVYDYVKSNKK